MLIQVQNKAMNASFQPKPVNFGLERICDKYVQYVYKWLKTSQKWEVREGQITLHLGTESAEFRD